ncbi:hypothetical protein E4T56_gene5666 [Termitomyces sp. T112]|nr:hypothetical protein E4T56_gene5666 [Termitomyces sp. T112]
MSAYNPAFNPTSYPTNIYSRLVPENYYAPFYSGPPTDHQEVLLDWHCPPTFSANGNHPCMYPGGFLGAPSAPPNPAYLPPAHYYVSPVPATAPTPLEQPDNYSSSQQPLSAQISPSPRQQQVEAYVQQCNEVLHSLSISLVEFARHACTLFVGLGYHDTSTTLEVWAD